MTFKGDDVVPQLWNNILSKKDVNGVQFHCLHCLWFSVQSNANVVSHPTRWSFSFILRPLHWSSLFPTSREQRNMVQLWTNSNGDRALLQIGCSVCVYHLIWIDCVTSQLIWRKIGVTVNICLTHNRLCGSWWKTGTLSGETCLLAKEKAKGSHMLVTIGTINATAIFICCTKNSAVISGAPDTIIITISLIAIFGGTTL